MDKHLAWLVAVNTLLHEVGVPLPLTPTVLLAAARSVAGDTHPVALICAVVVGTLAGNSIWFAAGRRYGGRVLKLLCRVSLSPDMCVQRTQDTFTRWGWSSLVVGRFIPGVSLVAPPVAGALGMSWFRFLALSAAGSALWALVVVAAGMLFHQQLDAALEFVSAFGRETIAAVVLLLVLYVGWRWWARRRAAQRLDVPRVNVSDLKAMFDRGEAPLVVDVRGKATRQIDPRRIPTAIVIELHAVEPVSFDLPRDREIVVYCDCPNEASAATFARALLARGYRVRPLLGGLDAWVVAGHAVDREGDVESAPSGATSLTSAS